MLADTNERPGISETYAGAVGRGSSQVINDPQRKTPGDLIASAGMSPYRLGASLMRMQSQWQGSAAPPRAEVPDVKALARQAARDRAEGGIDHATMTLDQKRAIRAGAKVQRSDLDLAAAEQRRLYARATDWSMAENKLRFQQLKELPTVRAALNRYATQRGWIDEAAALVAEALRCYLSPVCHACLGRKRGVIEGTARAIGKECRKCRGTGEVRVSGKIRSMVGYLHSCAGEAAGDLREGAYKLRRSDGGTKTRAEHRHHEQVAKLRQADAEDREADARTPSQLADIRDAFAMGKTLRT